MATAMSAGSTPRTPCRASSRAKKARGNWVRTPAPSPVRASPPTAPRCVTLATNSRAICSTWCPGSPPMRATNPTPQESCSKRGS